MKAAEGFVFAFLYVFVFVFVNVFVFLDGERTVMKAAAGRGATGQAMCQAFLSVFVFKIVIAMVSVFVYRIVIAIVIVFVFVSLDIGYENCGRRGRDQTGNASKASINTNCVFVTR